MKSKTPHSLYELIGWIGVVFVLGSYYLLATGIVEGNSWVYHAMVLLGSASIAVISYVKRVYQPMALNLCFSALAIVALVRILFF